MCLLSINRLFTLSCLSANRIIMMNQKNDKHGDVLSSDMVMWMCHVQLYANVWGNFLLNEINLQQLKNVESVCISTFCF